MEVLVTGSEGLVGKMVCSTLAEQGHSAVKFDIAASGDVLDYRALKKAAEPCDAVVHCAALLGTTGQSSEQVMEVNLQGTWNVLSCALANGIQRIVFLSSVDVLGVFKGEREPDFLPLDESHRCYPRTPYAISKYLAERMCDLFSSAHKIDIVSLRPPGVWVAPTTYQWIANERMKHAAFEWDPYWEYGAFIDVRDLAQACVSSLNAKLSGYHSVFVSSDDITTSGQTSFGLSNRLLPKVEWRGGHQFEKNPFRTLLSNDTAKHLLGWAPTHLWSHFDENEQSP